MANNEKTTTYMRSVSMKRARMCLCVPTSSNVTLSEIKMSLDI